VQIALNFWREVKFALTDKELSVALKSRFKRR
jgi:hypothetical protein